MLAVVGHILDADDPELRTLDLAQRRFSREANRKDSNEESVIAALVWLAGCRLQMHNVKGTLHTLGHLRARSRGQFPTYECLAGFLEIGLQLALREYDKAEVGLQRLSIPEAEERFAARAKAFKLTCEGKILSARGQTDEARAKYEEAIESLRVGPAQVEDIAITVEICNDQGHLAYREGSQEEGDRAYGQAETLASHIHFRLAAGRSYRGRGALKDSVGQHQEAIDLFMQARKVYQECESSVGMLRTCISLGRASYALGNYRQALLYFEEAKIQCGQGRHPNEEAEINARIGDIMLAEGRYDKAAEFYERDLQIVSLQGTDRARAHALRNVGRIQRLQGNFMRAEGCLQESYEEFRKLGDRRGLGRTLGQIVYCCLSQEKTKKARQAVDMLAEVVDPLRNEQEKAIHAMLEGLVCRNEGDATKARNLLERSLRIFSSDPGFYTVTCRLELALAFQQLDQKEQAVSQLKQTIKEARGLKIHDLEQKALQVLQGIDRAEWGRVLHGGQVPTDGTFQAERVIVSVLELEIRELEPRFGLEEQKFQKTIDRLIEKFDAEVMCPEAILGSFGGGRLQLFFGLEDSCDSRKAYETAEAFYTMVRETQADLTASNSLGIAAGLTVGTVLKGTFGANDVRKFDVYGEPVEKARALVSAAKTGDVLIGEACYGAIKNQDEDAEAVSVIWRGESIVAYRRKPEPPRVFTGALGAPLGE